ncbi:MAG: ABC transporter substrate-binding protein [Bacteroidales bacterium]|nr:ABC transporter substrate-binding protein [Bacteroidales bacterium]MBR7176066.1 ABC transporter substrate-binding protein [Bacteroidales bacterium]
MRRLLLPILMLLFLSDVDAQQIVFTPQWLPQSQFAGYYVALEKGFYKEAGLDVVIEHTSSSDNAQNRLREGKCNAITMNVFDAIFNIDQGMEVVNVLQTALHTGLVIVPRNNDIKKLKDLSGKRVGIWRTHYYELSQIVNEDYDLNIEWIPFVQSVNLYISGAVDATMAMIYNEAYHIYASGFENVSFISLADYGYDFPEEGVYFTKEYYEKYPDKAKAFAEASRRGWEWTHEHPDEALDIVMKVIEKNNLPAGRQHQKWMLNEILRLQCDSISEKPTFELDENKVMQINELLIRYNRINDVVTKSRITGGRQ